jgi:hypothetical protein
MASKSSISTPSRSDARPRTERAATARFERHLAESRKRRPDLPTEIRRILKEQMWMGKRLASVEFALRLQNSTHYRLVSEELHRFARQQETPPAPGVETELGELFASS